MWTYSQSTGDLTSPTDAVVGAGYSGNGDGLNNPAAQQQEGVGPIPRGAWTIGDWFNDVGGKGPVVAHLTPAAETETFGRTGFMIHGDNAKLNHTASEGCIVLPNVLRLMMMQSGDRLLIVTE